MTFLSITRDSFANILVRLPPQEQINFTTFGLSSNELRPIALKVLREDKKLSAQFPPNIKAFYEREVGRITAEGKDEKGIELLRIFRYCVTHNFQSFARARSNRCLSPIEPSLVRRRSAEVAPVVQWTYPCPPGTQCSPTVGKDGTIYLGFQIINSDGTPRKEVLVPEWQTHSSAALDRDGNAYIGSPDGSLYSTNSDGTIRWKFSTGASIKSSPIVGDDGTIYVGSDDKFLYAINPDGKLKWKFETYGSIWSSPIVDSEGMIYVISETGFLYAMNANGSVKWKFGTRSLGGVLPEVGRDGTIYVGLWEPFRFDKNAHGKYYVSEWMPFLGAINVDGELKWKLEVSGPVSALAIGIKGIATGIGGTIYAQVGPTLYAVNPEDGFMKWGLSVRSSSFVGCPEIGDNGTIYVVISSGGLYAIDPEKGTARWVYNAFASITSAPSVGSDGTIYVLAGATLHAIKEVPVAP